MSPTRSALRRQTEPDSLSLFDQPGGSGDGRDVRVRCAWPSRSTPRRPRTSLPRPCSPDRTMPSRCWTTTRSHANWKRRPVPPPRRPNGRAWSATTYCTWSSRQASPPARTAAAPSAAPAASTARNAAPPADPSGRAFHADGVQIERIDRGAGCHEQAVALPAAEAQIGAGLGQVDLADQAVIICRVQTCYVKLEG